MERATPGSGPDAARRPILVTGAHRSGTTWVGEILAAAPGVAYVHEPFNPVTAVGISGARFPRFFEYVADDTDRADEYARALEHTLSFRYGVRRQVRALRSPAEAARATRDAWRFAVARATRARPLMKDPIAVFSTEWLAERFRMDVVLLVRHPAAFASSVLRLGWTHRFESFLEQPVLMERHLRPFEREIRRYARGEADPLGEATLLWRIIYSVVRDFHRRHPEWSLVRHEDLSRDPLGGFSELYDRLGLVLSRRARARIADSSAPANHSDARDVHGTRLDSAANVTSWKRRLSDAQVDRIRADVDDVAPEFYGEADW